MLELAQALLDELSTGLPLAVAVVVRVDGSAPRAIGTAMAVTPDGRAIGSISGGCVEGATFQVCQEVLVTGVPQLVEYGFSDTDAFAAGLTCGGRIEVHVRVVTPGLPADKPLIAQLRRAAAGQPAGIGVVMVGSQAALVAADDLVDLRVDLIGLGLNLNDLRRLRLDLESSVGAGLTRVTGILCDGEAIELVSVVCAGPPRMILFGAVDFSAALARVAQFMGYSVTVCDARPVFATQERFPGVEVVNRWPTDYLRETAVDARTVVCVLTHDDRFDVPLIRDALQLPVAYVGAMGSRQTDERRKTALRLLGVDELALAGLHSPLGLDIGASTPQDTAISILAEVIRTRTGASGSSLMSRTGSIHSS
ncbi:MAG TPA: XshC-Cox1-family protein [Chloroflexi bacterium]|nr:XshC-Cox1-family protein [Chloroflexota bacterium]